MYSDPKRWSYLFESYVLLTMMEVHHRPQVQYEKFYGVVQIIIFFMIIIEVFISYKALHATDKDKACFTLLSLQTIADPKV